MPDEEDCKNMALVLGLALIDGDTGVIRSVVARLNVSPWALLELTRKRVETGRWP